MSQRSYFGTDGIRGVAGEHPMTAPFALRLGAATAENLRRNGNGRPRVVIGMDTRRSGPMLAYAAAAGLASRGATVTWLGVVPTPGVSFLTRALGADAGMVVSASHNPFPDNGLKLFNQDGEKLSDGAEADIEALLEALDDRGMAALEPVVGDEVGALNGMVAGASPNAGGSTPVGGNPALEPYVQHLLANAPYLDGLRVALDCAQGASHAIAPRVFQKIGARLEVLNATPDGTNINVACGSTHPDTLREHVVSGNFDVGITFDGDADRALLVDRRGRLVSGDHILAICALSRGEKEVVATAMSNLGTERYLAERGVTLHRVKVGDRYVFEDLKRRSLSLGGEQSGHMLFLDKAPTGDGILTALQALSAVRKTGKPLEAWVDEIPVYPQVLLNVTVATAARDGLISDPTVSGAVESAERELGDDGRVVLRPSGTEPLIRVMVEGADGERVQALAERIAEAVRLASRSAA
ncbi:MAG: phosphoglucosamine mutase [Trueperaceae bacterium]